MIVTGDWLLPVSDRPLRDGAVLTRGSRIEMVGPLGGLVAVAPTEPVERFAGCVVMPGLVNAHTHLSLTVLGGLVEPMPMRRFRAIAATALRAMSDDDLAASAALGALLSLRSGVTFVGDIAHGPEPLAASADTGLGGVFFWEVCGIDAADLPRELSAREFPIEAGDCATGRSRCGVSPRSAYESGPDLLRAARETARSHGVGFALCVSESPDERDLMLHGTGPLTRTATPVAPGFRPPGVGSVAYLESLGVLQDAVAVHCTNLEAGDAGRLKKRARGVVLCPRSNAFLSNGEPPVAELSRTGIHLAIGTGSPTGDRDLDLWEDARALRALDPTLTARRVVAMLTRDAALVLGLDRVCGALDRGLQADLTVVRTGATDDPETAVVASGGASTVAAVMSAGLWRVRAGKSTLPDAAVERASARSRAVVERVLASDDCTALA